MNGPPGVSCRMALSGNYVPSTIQWVRDHVDIYERSGGTRATTIRGFPVIILTSKGATSGDIRKTPLMRVEHDGSYAVIASLGGAPKHPVWYGNLIADGNVALQDGPVTWDMVAREATGDEKEIWWNRAVDAFPDFADYQKKTDRQIPVLVVEPRPT